MLAFLSAGVRFAEGLGEMFQFFHNSLCSHPRFPHGNVAEQKGGTRMEKGVGESAKNFCSSSWTWLCHSHPNSPNDTNPWGHSPLNSLLCTSRVLLICLHEMNSSAPLAWSCAQTTPELGCSALQELSAPWDAHKSQHWLDCWIKHNWTVLCQFILSFPLHQPFSTSVNSGFKVFYLHQVSKTLWQICLGRAVFAPFSTSGKRCALKGVEGFSINHCYLKKTIDAEAFKKIQSCSMKPVTKMLLTWPFISCSLREKVV